MEIDKQAGELNEVLKESSSPVYSLLSERGRKSYYPKAGILSQSADAKGKDLNATIGVALDEGGNPLTLNFIMENSGLEPDKTVSYSSSYGVEDLRKKWLQRIKQSNPDLIGKTILPVCSNG